MSGDGRRRTLSHYGAAAFRADAVGAAHHPDRVGSPRYLLPRRPRSLPIQRCENATQFLTLLSSFLTALRRICSLSILFFLSATSIPSGFLDRNAIDLYIFTNFKCDAELYGIILIDRSLLVLSFHDDCRSIIMRQLVLTQLLKGDFLRYYSNYAFHVYE